MDDNLQSGGDQARVIACNVADQQALYRSYMPFIRNGGFFVPEPSLAGASFDLEEKVFLRLHLEDQDEHLTVSGRIVWVARSGARRRPGVGIQFAELEGAPVKQRLETLLAGQLDSDQPTDTL
jgi:type IV pilus assembly protein PilZ